MVSVRFMISHYNFQMSCTLISPCNFVMKLFGGSSQCNAHADFTIESPWYGHMRIIKWMVMSPGDLTQNNSHSNILLESQNDVYFRLIINRLIDIIVWFILAILTFVTICDVKRWRYLDWLCCSNSIYLLHFMFISLSFEYSQLTKFEFFICCLTVVYQCIKSLH